MALAAFPKISRIEVEDALLGHSVTHHDPLDQLGMEPTGHALRVAIVPPFYIVERMAAESSADCAPACCCR